jgi:hypothetical protein
MCRVNHASTHSTGQKSKIRAGKIGQSYHLSLGNVNHAPLSNPRAGKARKGNPTLSSGADYKGFEPTANEKANKNLNSLVKF